MIKTLEWTDAGVRFIDQTKLPLEETYVTCATYEEVAEAIRTMIVRGAPAIGVAAAMGIALGVRDAPAGSLAELRGHMDRICGTLAATRPTAVNLFWAVRRMRHCFEQAAGRAPAAATGGPHLSRPALGGGTNVGTDPAQLRAIREALIAEAQLMHAEDVAANQAMGRHGAVLMPDSGGVLTHCNAGALATCGYGTALGVIRAAVEGGKQLHVFADETRPFLQGSRLTAWELLQDAIPTTLISDNMAGAMMRLGKIKAVVVGADRIAANGDVANKIGTYSVAVLAHENHIPFYVAAPFSTVDWGTADGDAIPIEQRSPQEVTHLAGRRIAPEGVEVENPAFDVTPAPYVTAIVTERGIARPPFTESLRKLAGQ
jgi:methylthioribose-1-phosphate isomerase